MKKVLSREFNIDTGCVEDKYADGSTIHFRRIVVNSEKL
jgi:hypothetical protein